MVSLVLQLCLVVTIEIILNFIKYFFWISVKWNFELYTTIQVSVLLTNN